MDISELGADQTGACLVSNYLVVGWVSDGSLRWHLRGEIAFQGATWSPVYPDVRSQSNFNGIIMSFANQTDPLPNSLKAHLIYDPFTDNSPQSLPLVAKSV